MHDYLLDLSEPSNQTVQATVTHPRRLPTLEWVTIQDLQNPDTYRASFMTFTIKRETPYCWSEHLQKMAFQSKTTEMDPYCCSVSPIVCYLGSLHITCRNILEYTTLVWWRVLGGGSGFFLIARLCDLRFL